jgi:hypothetical protein
MGPNVKKLVAMRIAKVAIPDNGKFADGIEFLLNKERVLETAKKATEWVKTAIQAVRDAPGDNPFRSADDETIAAEILRKAGG